ncbi:MAG: phosphoglycerate dehydrogenase [Rhodanobacteraceae bacterium]|nr:MAG: phosphoglycerate dehydrogenase [Rhodanobacteraceae bacterium]
MKTSFPKQDIKIVLLEGIHQSAVDAFHAAGYTNITHHEKALPRDELFAAIADAHVIGLRSRTQLDQEAISHTRHLFAVGCFCIGTNQVDLTQTGQLGVPVFNAPYSNTRSVAELVIAEAILLLRRVPERNASCHRGGWAKSADGSFEARGKTIGIIGYGHIGTQVGVLAEALGMHVLYHDIEAKLALGNAARARSLDELLARADVVTLHVPATAETKGMLGAAEIARMHAGAMLINASRGNVVNIDALVEALRNKRIAGAAVDVFPKEPKSRDEAFESALREFDNVLLTPHVGGSTQEAQRNIGTEVASKLVRYSDNGSTLSAVNFPEVNLPEHAGSSRLLHIHHNVPGVLSRINDVFSKLGVNINGQHLQTAGDLGYVVLDASASDAQSEALREQLSAIPGTIRTRLLY